VRKIIFGVFTLTALASNLWAVPGNPFKAWRRLDRQFDGKLPGVDVKPGLVLVKRSEPKKVSEWRDTARFGCTGHSFRADGTYAGPAWCSYDNPRKIETFEETLTWQVANPNAYINHEKREGRNRGMAIGGSLGVLAGLAQTGILGLLLGGAMPLTAYALSAALLGFTGVCWGGDSGRNYAELKASEKANRSIFTETRSFTIEHPL